MPKKKSIVVVSGEGSAASPYEYSGENIDVVVVLSDAYFIGWGAFSDCVNITRVHICDGITSIGVRAFKGCNIKRVRIPDSVISVGMGGQVPKSLIYFCSWTFYTETGVGFRAHNRL